MKHMLAFLPANEPISVISQENMDETLSIEGMTDAFKNPLKTLKAKFTLTSDEAFTKDIKVKRALLLQEKKKLEQAKAGFSKAKDSGEHKVNLKKVMTKVNFSASTPEQVITGFQKNRKFVNSLIQDMNKASSKASADKIKDRFDAEMNKRGTLKEEMTLNKTQAMKMLDECILMNDTLIEFLDTLEKMKESHLSTEGLGSFIVGVFADLIAYGVSLFVGVLTWMLIMMAIALVFMQPWWAVPIIFGGLLFYGISTSSKEDHVDHLLAGH